MVEDSADQAQTQTTTTDTKRGLTPWLTLALLTPLLYVLSIGPVARYYGPRPTPELVGAFYVPLEFAINRIRPLSDFMDWYLAIWLPTPSKGPAPTATPTTSNTSTN